MASVINQLYYLGYATLWRRDLLKPTYVIDTFADLEIPKHTRLVVLDKDNCFAKPHALTVWPAFQKRWHELVANDGKEYEMVIVSNTAGCTGVDPHGELARTLEQNTGVRVTHHKEKKPMCYEELCSTFKYDPKEMLVVGDRLATDVLLANLMCAESVWIRGGVHPNALNRLEMRFLDRTR